METHGLVCYNAKYPYFVTKEPVLERIMEATMKQFMTILKAALRNERVVPAEEISPEAWERRSR